MARNDQQPEEINKDASPEIEPSAPLDPTPEAEVVDEDDATDRQPDQIEDYADYVRSVHEAADNDDTVPVEL